MMRIRLYTVEALIQDDFIEELFEPFLVPADPLVDELAPWRVIEGKVTVEQIMPGLSRAIIQEFKKLHVLGLPVVELIIWDRNKVRANPGPSYPDPRDADDYSIIGARVH